MICNLNEFSEFKKITTVDGYQMLVNPYDHYICRDLANDGQWEPHIRKVINNYFFRYALKKYQKPSPIPSPLSNSK